MDDDGEQNLNRINPAFLSTRQLSYVLHHVVQEEKSYKKTFKDA